MSQTPLKLIFIVVVTIGLMAFIGFASLCAGLFVHIYADGSVMASILTLEGTLLGYLGGVLTNTRQAPPTTTTTSSTSQTIPDPLAAPPAPPAPTAPPGTPADPAHIVIDKLPTQQTSKEVKT